LIRMVALQGTWSKFYSGSSRRKLREQIEALEPV